MQLLTKEVKLKDGTKCILRSPDENDAEKMIEYLRMTSGETYFMNLKKVNHRGEFGISIKQKFWNKGIGDILISEIISEAKKIGYNQIELGVFSDNKKAQSIYKKHGFKEWGNIKNAYKLSDGTYRDEIVMGRIL